MSNNHPDLTQQPSTLDLKVSGMSCQGCVSKVRKSIQEIDENALITGFPKENHLKVNTVLSQKSVESCIQETGFQPQGEYEKNSDQTYDDENKKDKDSPVKQSNNTNERAHNNQFTLSGVTCAGCINTIQKTLDHLEGVNKADVNFATRTAQVSSTLSANHVIQAIESAGYGASLVQDPEQAAKQQQSNEHKEYKQKQNAAGISFALGIPLMLYTWFGGSMTVTNSTQQITWLIISLITLGVMISAGRHFYTSAYKAFLHRQSNMDTLISLGTISAWVYSFCVVVTPNLFPFGSRHLYFESSVMILGFINLGQAIEVRARGKSSEALRRLLDLTPKMANVIRDKQERHIPVSDIQIGDKIRIRAGDTIPVDGEITQGESSIDESMLTGESIPIEKHPSDYVAAGTLNGNGSFSYIATKIGAQTMLAKIIDMVSRAQNSKPPISQLADKVSAIFVPSVMIIAIITALAWFNLGTQSVVIHMLIATISVLIIACPCALGLATPISTMIGIGKAAQFGALIRNGDALQTASKLTTLVLDKTGTITQGKPQVVSSQHFHNADERSVAQWLTALEEGANHPLAQALLDYAKPLAQNIPAISCFESLDGLGLQGKIDGNMYFVGNERLMNQQDISLAAITNGSTLSSTTKVYLARDKSLLAVFEIQDPVKRSAKIAIRKMQRSGLKVVMLTGDNQSSGANVAKQIGITEYHCELLPKDKLNWIQTWQDQGETVGMIGDGINDAPALVQANVGFAMGAGTDVAMQSADMTLMHNDLLKVLDVIAISKVTLSNIKQNLWGAFAYNCLGIPLAAGLLYPFTGWMLSPLIAGAAMSLSSITVVSNANRLRFFKQNNASQNGQYK